MIRYVGSKYVEIWDRIRDWGSDQIGVIGGEEDEFKDQPRLIYIKPTHWFIYIISKFSQNAVYISGITFCRILIFYTKNGSHLFMLSLSVINIKFDLYIRIESYYFII